MRKYMLSLMAIALIAPTAVSAATLPVKTTGETDRPLVLVGDGDQSRHWRSYAGASHDWPPPAQGGFAPHGSAPRTGFALQAPAIPFFGGGARESSSAPLRQRYHPSYRGGTVAESHAGAAARYSR